MRATPTRSRSTTSPREAGLSRAHFSVAFKRAFGVTPHVYLLTRRLERAAHLLRHTDRSGDRRSAWTWASRSVGSFTATFRRLYGLTPDRLSRGVSAGARPGASSPRACCAPTDCRRTERFEKRRRALEAAASVAPTPGTDHRGGRTRCIKIATTQLWVHDQDEALAFYTTKLGMEVRQDVTVPEMGNFRWLTVVAQGPARRGHRAHGHPRRAGHGPRDRRRRSGS